MPVRVLAQLALERDAIGAAHAGADVTLLTPIREAGVEVPDRRDEPVDARPR